MKFQDDESTGFIKLKNSCQIYSINWKLRWVTYKLLISNIKLINKLNEKSGADNTGIPS